MLSFLEAEVAKSKDNPHKFRRKETVRDFESVELRGSEMGLREEVEYKWPWQIGEALHLNCWSSLTEIKRSIWFDCRKN